MCVSRYELLLGLHSVAEGRGAAAGVECPGVGEWIGLAAQNIEPATRRRLNEHLAACDACAALWRHLLDAGESREFDWELRDAPSAIESGAGGGRVGYRFRALSLLARAAVVVLGSSILIALASGVLPRIGVGADERWRGPNPVLSASVSQDLESAIPVLQWEAWPDATSYRIRVWDRTGNGLVDRSVPPDTEKFELVLDAPPGTVLLWQIEAVEEGSVTAQTPPTSLVWSER